MNLIFGRNRDENRLEAELSDNAHIMYFYQVQSPLTGSTY